MEYKELFINDKLYPNQLRSIKNPPQKLYVLGNEKILNSECLSIIGSRNCTDSGAEIARNFARKIARKRDNNC